MQVIAYFFVIFLLGDIKYRSAGSRRELDQQAHGKEYGDDG